MNKVPSRPTDTERRLIAGVRIGCQILLLVVTVLGIRVNVRELGR